MFRGLMATMVLGLGLLGSKAWGGPTSSGGGNAVVCYSADGKMSTAELLDFYEGRHVFRDRYRDLRGLSMLQILERAGQQLMKTGYGFELRPSGRVFEADLVTQNIMKHRKFVDSRDMPQINDSMHDVPLTRNCRVQQAAAYLNDKEILFDEKIWNLMSPFDQAGLMLHEVIYWYERKLGMASDSRRARRATASIFNRDFEIINVYQVMVDWTETAPVYTCISGTSVAGDPELGMSGMTSFRILESQGQMYFLFYWIGGEPVMTNTGAFAQRKLANGLHVFDFTLNPSFGETVNLRVTSDDRGQAVVEGRRTGYAGREIPRTKVRCFLFDN